MTDHKPLVYAFLKKTDHSCDRVSRQLEEIGQYSTKIVHVSGKENVVADAFSRVHAIDTPVIFSTQELADHQRDDAELKQFLETPEKTSLQLRGLRVDGTEAIVYCDISTADIRPFIPRILRKQVFDNAHNLSHPSGRATRRTIGRRFVWPKMNRDIQEWARSCLACQRCKISRHVKNVPQHISIPGERFRHVHVDIVMMQPSKGYRYLLTLIDRFSIWPEAVPMRDVTADTVIDAFYTGWVSRFGAPETITSDRGSQFESVLFEALSKLIGSSRTRTTAYHPASNGMIERWHRSFKTAIMCHNTPDWTNILPTVLLGLRTSYKEDVKTTSAELVYGTTLRLPGEFFIDDETPLHPQFFIEKFREQMRQVRSAPTAHHIKHKAFAHKTLYTCTHVFVRVDAVKKPCEKPYDGPYEIMERISDQVFRINLRGAAATISTERLKPAFFEKETTATAITEPTCHPMTSSSQPSVTAPTATHQVPVKPFSQLTVKTYPGRRVHFANR